MGVRERTMRRAGVFTALLLGALVLSAQRPSRGGGRGGIRHVASGARPFQGAGAGEGEEGLGVAAEVEGRARVDDHRGRHGQRVGTAVEHRAAGLDGGAAAGAGTPGG